MIRETKDHETMHNIMMYSIFVWFLDYHAQKVI